MDPTPLTDFCRVGRGYATKSEAHGMFTYYEEPEKEREYEEEQLTRERNVQ